MGAAILHDNDNGYLIIFLLFLCLPKLLKLEEELRQFLLIFKHECLLNSLCFCVFRSF